MRKKIVALLMALTMVPALAACGSSSLRQQQWHRQ